MSFYETFNSYIPVVESVAAGLILSLVFRVIKLYLIKFNYSRALTWVTKNMPWFLLLLNFVFTIAIYFSFHKDFNVFILFINFLTIFGSSLLFHLTIGKYVLDKIFNKKFVEKIIDKKIDVVIEQTSESGDDYVETN